MPETSKSKSTTYPLRRYTNLASTIHLLNSRKLSLLDPNKWDDGNDVHFMSEYKRKRLKKSLLAVCFAETFETYHHWKVFSSGPDGVCIEFHKKALLQQISEQDGISWGSVRYRLIDALIKKRTIAAEELPYLKRRPYKDEKEFRILFTDKNAELSVLDIPIELASIKRITLSPWMPAPLRESVVSTLKSIDGCESLPIFRSTLVGNSKWKEISDRVV